MDYSAFHWSEKARKYAETLGTIFNVKGRVNAVSDLPSTGNKIGDVYLVGLTTDPDLTEYAWLSFDNVTRWEKLGSTATSLAFSALTGSPNDNVALKNALDGKYDANNPNGYTSNVGTVTSVNNTSPDGNGNVTITIPDPLPSQTGQNGKYLTTNGTTASWENIPSDSSKANTSLDNLDATGQAIIDGKVDLNLNNMNPSATAKETIVGWGMPDLSRQTTLTVTTTPQQASYNMFVVLSLGVGNYLLVADSSSATLSDAIRRFGFINGSGSEFQSGTTVIAKGEWYYSKSNSDINAYACPFKGE